MNTLDKAILASKIIRERKAINPVLFEVGKLTSISDYFLIASGNSSRQVKALADHVVEKVKEQSEAANRVMGDKRFFVMPVPISNPTLARRRWFPLMSLEASGQPRFCMLNLPSDRGGSSP